MPSSEVSCDCWKDLGFNGCPRLLKPLSALTGNKSSKKKNTHNILSCVWIVVKKADHVNQIINIQKWPGSYAKKFDKNFQFLLKT